MVCLFVHVCNFKVLTDVFLKVGALSLMSLRVMVAVPVVDKPLGAPFKSLSSMITVYLSLT